MKNIRDDDERKRYVVTFRQADGAAYLGKKNVTCFMNNWDVIV